MISYWLDKIRLRFGLPYPPLLDNKSNNFQIGAQKTRKQFESPFAGCEIWKMTSKIENQIRVFVIQGLFFVKIGKVMWNLLENHSESLHKKPCVWIHDKVIAQSCLFVMFSKNLHQQKFLKNCIDSINNQHFYHTFYNTLSSHIIPIKKWFCLITLTSLVLSCYLKSC